MGKQQKTQKDTKQPQNEKIVEQSKIGVINKKSSKGGTASKNRTRNTNTKIPVRQSNRKRTSVPTYADIPDSEINNDVTSTDSSKRTTSSKKKTEQAPKQKKTATSSNVQNEQEKFFDSTLSLEEKLQILDTYKDFGRYDSGLDLVTEVLSDKPKPYKPSRVAEDIGSYRTKFLKYNKLDYVRTNISVHELLGKLFAKNTEKKQIVLERTGYNYMTKFQKYHCNGCDFYKEFKSLANYYDEKNVPPLNKDINIEIKTTEDDGLLIINNVELINKKNFTYEIDEDEYKTKYKINLDKIKKNPGPAKSIPFIKKILNNNKVVDTTEETTTEINNIFELNYSKYNETLDAKKKYIKCLFDFKRLGDLQLIKVAKKYELPFITGDRLAAIIANRCYGVTSVYIQRSNVELHEKIGKDEFTVTFYTIEDTIKHLLSTIYTFSNYNKKDEAKNYIKEYIPDYYWKSLRKLLVKNMKTGTYVEPEETGTDVEDSESVMSVYQTGGNPQDLPEKMNEDRWYYAEGLFKIIKEYVPRDKGTVGDNTVLLFQYMFLGYMYDLHDEDVIDYVEKYLKSSSIEQSATDYKSLAKQVYTFQPDIPEKRTLPYDNSKQYVPDNATQVKQVYTLQPDIPEKRTLPYDNSKQYVPDNATQLKQVQTLQPGIPEKRTLPYDNSKQYVPDDATQVNQVQTFQPGIQEKRTLPYDNSKQYVPDDATQVKQVQTFQPGIPEKRTLPYDNSKQYVPYDATHVKHVQTLQPGIQDKRTLPYDNSKQYVPDDATQTSRKSHTRSPHNIQQSVSKDTHTDVYNNNYNGIIDTATSIPIMVGGKQKTTKFMKNVIKDFKKLFV
jgi:hypothetical protein